MENQTRLLELFESYYDVVLSQKLKHIQQGQENPTPSSPASEPGDSSPDALSEVAQTHQILLQYLLDQEARNSYRFESQYEVEAYEEVRYAMASLADEIMLNIPWSGQDAWLDYLLESALFDSRIAGSQIFECIEALCVRPSKAPYNQWPTDLRRDLAQVYLRVLQLGFEGEYRRSEVPESVQGDTPEADKERSIQSLLDRDVNYYHTLVQSYLEVEMLVPGRELFPDALRNTLDQGRGGAFANLQKIYRNAVFLVIVTLIFSSVLWLLVAIPYRNLLGNS